MQNRLLKWYSAIDELLAAKGSVEDGDAIPVQARNIHSHWHGSIYNMSFSCADSRRVWTGVLCSLWISHNMTAVSLLLSRTWAVLLLGRDRPPPASINSQVEAARKRLREFFRTVPIILLNKSFCAFWYLGGAIEATPRWVPLRPWPCMAHGRLPWWHLAPGRALWP